MSARGPVKLSGLGRRIMLPLARMLRLLGFELRFWWTLPIPYHPLIAFLLPFVPLGLAAWAGLHLAGGGRSPVPWSGFIVTGLLLVIPLSIPVLNVVAVAFRVPLLQGFCFLAGIGILAVEVLNGIRPVGHGILPAAFFAIFAMQRIGGPRLLAQLQADNAMFKPLSAGGRMVRYRSSAPAPAKVRQAQRLFEQSGLAWLAIAPARWRMRGQLLLRPDAEAAAMLRSQLEPGEWQAGKGGLRLDDVEVPALADSVAIAVRAGRSWLLSGCLATVTISDRSSRRRLSAGRPAPVGNWPLFFLAYDFAVFSGGARKGSWQAGFVPGQPVALGDRTADELLEAALIPQNPSAEVSGQALEAALAAMLPRLIRRRSVRLAAREKQAQAAAVALERWLVGGASPKAFRNWRLLVVRPETLAGKGRQLCARLAEAKAARDRHAAAVAASLLAALPLDEFLACEDELIPLLGSRVLALEWQLTPGLDLSALPKACPRWGPIAGFGLMSRVPELWARLGELGPRADRIIAAFIKEVGERPVLVSARMRSDERRSERSAL